MLLTYLLFIGLHVSEDGPPETTTSTAVVSVHTGRITSTPYSSKAPNNTGNSVLFFILFPALLLPLGLRGVIYWRCRGRSRGQTDGKEQVRTNTEQQSQDEVMYATVVHSNTTTTTTTVIDIEEKAEYATIRADRPTVALAWPVPVVEGRSLPESMPVAHIANTVVLTPALEPAVQHIKPDEYFASSLDEMSFILHMNDHSAGILVFAQSHGKALGRPSKAWLPGKQVIAALPLSLRALS
ncbi:hypothetical protein SRHO_G00074450 [Serrasalmus rhombeus]